MKFELSKTEQDILDLLWERGQWMSGSNFWEYFNSHGKICKRSTVNTYLTRMTAKGLLVKNGTKYIYAYTREEFEEKKAREILDTMYNGSLAKFISAFTGRKKLTSEEACQLKEYLNHFEEN